MQQVLGALIGVPATILVAGGLGLVGVTFYNRLFPSRGREPTRWGQVALGFLTCAVGAFLIVLEIVLFGAG